MDSLCAILPTDMKQLYIIIISLITWSNLTGQQIDTISLDCDYFGEYLGLDKPGSIPKIFAPGLISGKGRMHSFITFAPDMKTIFWGTIPPKIMMIQMIDKKWTSPEIAPFSNTNNNQSPFIAVNDKIYFSSTRAGGLGDLDIWYTTLTDGNFIEPINIGEVINSKKLESHPTISNKNGIFFTGTIEGKLYSRGIYYSEFINGGYIKSYLLPEPINLMDPNILDYTPFIAPDESYLLFCSNRQNPEIELCHIYISYKNSNGEWEEPVDLSKKMGFIESSKFPYVTPDNRFLFFSSGENVYWIDSNILKLENK
jgi:hypothetical protein